MQNLDDQTVEVDLKDVVYGAGITKSLSLDVFATLHDSAWFVGEVLDDFLDFDV